LYLQRGRPPIYRLKSLGKEEKRVEGEGTKYGVARVLTLVNATPFNLF